MILSSWHQTCLLVDRCELSHNHSAKSQSQALTLVYYLFRSIKMKASQ